MLLVDPNYFSHGNDFRNIKRHHSLLDQSISDVLNREDVNDYDKLKLYQNALGKFLVNRQNVEFELDKPIKVQTEEPKQPTAKETYLSSLPKTEREKAERVLADVEKYTPIRFTDKGQVNRDGIIIDDSNLEELVTHELKGRHTKGQNKPAGWDFFSSYHKAKEASAAATTGPVKRPKRQRKPNKRLLSDA